MDDKTKKVPIPRAKDPRSHTLRVRLTKGELKKLQETARSSGRTVSDVVREAAVKATVRFRDQATVRAERDRLVMLNRINANLNMIAHWANRYRRAGEAVEVISHLVAIEREVTRSDL